MAGGTMTMKHRWGWELLVGGVLIGCGQAPEESRGTGAKECVQAYYEALVRKDWPGAYATLDPHSQKRCSPQQFSRLAQSYRSNLGFDPTAVQLRACEEHGLEATAHIVLTGRSASGTRRYKDAITLRRNGDWHVVLPHNFGQNKTKFSGGS
jgi:hypothetical protein